MNNYWRWLKRKFVKEQNQLVSDTHGLKFLAPDAKKRLADTLDSDGVMSLAKRLNLRMVLFTMLVFLHSNGIKIRAKDGSCYQGMNYTL